MIPQIVKLEELPLTPNGKIDRKRLPLPDHLGPDRKAYVPPQDNLERSISDIWAQVLNVEKCGVTDDFLQWVGIHCSLHRHL